MSDDCFNDSEENVLPQPPLVVQREVNVPVVRDRSIKKVFLVLYSILDT